MTLCMCQVVARLQHTAPPVPHTVQRYTSSTVLHWRAGLWAWPVWRVGATAGSVRELVLVVVYNLLFLATCVKENIHTFIIII